MSKIKDITGNLFPESTDPRPCPKCYRYPVLIVGDHISHYKCTRWFGLKICFKGPDVFEGVRDGGWAQRVAARAWNNNVKSFLGEK